MPRVHHRKAAKDYPAMGIAKGDMYYTWRIKAAYGGTTYRSKTAPKPSQLTKSPFKSGYLSAWESWTDSSHTSGDAQSLADDLRSVGSECEESFGNMPEGLQQGDTGQMLEERAYALEMMADGVEEKARELEELENERDGYQQFMDENAPEDGSDDDQSDEYIDAENEHAEAESQIENTIDEIHNLDDMPE